MHKRRRGSWSRWPAPGPGPAPEEPTEETYDYDPDAVVVEIDGEPVVVTDENMAEVIERLGATALLDDEGNLVGAVLPPAEPDEREPVVDSDGVERETQEIETHDLASISDVLGVEVTGVSLVEVDDTAESEPVDVSVYATGGGWYELPDGTKVQGAAAAAEALAALEVEGSTPE